ncbi:MAG: tyrosine-type recombinase/integrase [Bdellovibrionaceae bacterium]|nr:tyrosine-type recombinase/integrase [Pseudobdellovibrionaceae bacterium]
MFNKKLKKNELVSLNNKSTGESFLPLQGILFKNAEDMALIAAWVYQKGPKTQIYYKRVVKEFYEFYPHLNLKTTQITHLVLFLKSYKQFSDSTRNTYKNALRSLFSFTMKTSYLEKNPSLALENLKTPDRLHSKVLSREQIERMIQIESNPRNVLILKILYFTGIRVDELTQLKVNSFQSTTDGSDMVMLVIGKGRKVRSVHIPPHLKEDILDYVIELNSGDHLFTNDRRVDFGLNDFTRAKLNHSQIFRIVKAAARNAALDVEPSPHWLRHTSATHAPELRCMRSAGMS